jgi:toxin ParE1/3/4
MKRSALRARAVADLEAAHDYYLNEVSKEISDSFVFSFDQAIEHIENFPSSGSTRYRELLDFQLLRTWSFKTFPYALFYLEKDELADIIRILHLHSDIPSQLRDIETT